MLASRTIDGWLGVDQLFVQASFRSFAWKLIRPTARPPSPWQQVAYDRKRQTSKDRQFPWRHIAQGSRRQMGISEGDVLHIIPDDADGVLLTPFDPHFESAMVALPERERNIATHCECSRNNAPIVIARIPGCELALTATAGASRLANCDWQCNVD